MRQVFRLLTHSLDGMLLELNRRHLGRKNRELWDEGRKANGVTGFVTQSLKEMRGKKVSEEVNPRFAKDSVNKEDVGSGWCLLLLIGAGGAYRGRETNVSDGYASTASQNRGNLKGEGYVKTCLDSCCPSHSSISIMIMKEVKRIKVEGIGVAEQLRMSWLSALSLVTLLHCDWEENRRLLQYKMIRIYTLPFPLLREISH